MDLDLGIYWELISMSACGAAWLNLRRLAGEDCTLLCAILVESDLMQQIFFMHHGGIKHLAAWLGSWTLSISSSRCAECHLMKAFISCSPPPGLIRQTSNCVMAASLLSGPNPHKSSAWRVNTWRAVLREISFVLASTVSSAFKWHQTGGTLFQAYKWASAQVLHLIDRQSQIADRPRTEFSKWFIMCFYSPFKWLASLISLRPDGFKSPLLLKT